ncbi:MAG: BrnA antitoxin family protein [Pseudomonadota bacterium]
MALGDGKPGVTAEDLKEFNQGLDEIREFHRQYWERQKARETVPAEWFHLHKDTPTTVRKTKMTLSLDQDMADWYRSLGRGYQRRMNMILRTYMAAIVAEFINDGRRAE